MTAIKAIYRVGRGKEDFISTPVNVFLKYDIFDHHLHTTSEPSIGSVQWTNTFEPKILKYIIKITENATLPNHLASSTIVTS